MDKTPMYKMPKCPECNGCKHYYVCKRNAKFAPLAKAWLADREGGGDDG